MISRRTMIRSTATIAASLFISRQGHAAISAGPSGFFMPDEALLHERTFMQWPVNSSIHKDAAKLETLQATIANIANTISEFEPVVMLMAKEHEAQARKSLSAKVEIWDIATDDLWARDSGPAFVISGKGGLGITEFNFNGWGNKQPHDNDAKIASRVAERMGLQVFNGGLVGEPGGVETDGAGTLFAHESSWINPNRNAGDKADIERRLLETLGAKRVIWAPGVKGADITDYHIDALVRSIKPGIVAVQLPDEIDENDPWSVAAFETYSILENQKSLQNLNMQLVIFPEPLKPRIQSKDFVASYVNYYLCNGAVICPEFGDEATDSEAKQILKEIYTDRAIIALNVDTLGQIGGGIHCATMQQPKV